jgi:glucose-6-phosphate-specific signal transduction histidine kinase
VSDPLDKVNIDQVMAEVGFEMTMERSKEIDRLRAAMLAAVNAMDNSDNLTAYRILCEILNEE